VWAANTGTQNDRKFYEILLERLPTDTKFFLCCDKSAVNEARCFGILGFCYQFKSWAGVKDCLVKTSSDEREGLVVERFYVCKQGEFVGEWIAHFYLFCDVVLTLSDKFGVPFREKDLQSDLVDRKLRRVGVLPTGGDMWIVDGT
jgi:hypothetical protein